MQLSGAPISVENGHETLPYWTELRVLRREERRLGGSKCRSHRMQDCRCRSIADQAADLILSRIFAKGAGPMVLTKETRDVSCWRRARSGDSMKVNIPHFSKATIADLPFPEREHLVFGGILLVAR